MFIFGLTNCLASPYNLNVFKTSASRSHSEATRSLILRTALDSFRERGVDAVTMREIAKSADIALGAAYYYFPSKEAIVQAYYDQVQADHLARVSAQFAEAKHNLLERLKIAFHSKLDILKRDRKLLGALFRYAGEPWHPLSIFGPATKVNREQSIGVFRLAIGDERLPEDIGTVLPLALWTVSMSFLLYYIYDDSPQQERTRKLVDGGLEILVRLLSIAKSPLLKPVRGSLFALLRHTRLLPEQTSPAPHSPQEVRP
jgi:AcrR family transcriptional regulator